MSGYFVELVNDTLVDLFWAMDHASDDDINNGDNNNVNDGGDNGDNGNINNSRSNEDNDNNHNSNNNQQPSYPPQLDILTDAYDTVYIRNCVVKPLQSYEEMMTMFHRASKHRHSDVVDVDG